MQGFFVGRSKNDNIRIRKVETPVAPVVSSIEVDRARETLRLCLEQIKFASAREDQILFDSSVQQAKRLTKHYFHTTSGAGLRVLATLNSVEKQKISLDIPDASTGLRELRNFRARLIKEQISSAEVAR